MNAVIDVVTAIAVITVIAECFELFESFKRWKVNVEIKLISDIYVENNNYHIHKAVQNFKMVTQRSISSVYKILM